MYKSYFIVAFRNLLRQKAHNILNILGLSIGIASGLIIALHIRGELSYETSFPGYNDIYRVHRNGWAASSAVLASEFTSSFPEVEAMTRFALFHPRLVDTEKNNPGEATGFFADSTVFSVFGFPLLDGDPQPLRAVNTAVISRSMAQRFFGDASPIGQTLIVENGARFTVTAVMEDLPANTHLKFDYLISMSTFYREQFEDVDLRRGWMTMYSYIRIKPDAFGSVVSRMPQFIHKYYQGDPGVEEEVASGAWRLMPLKDIHLYSNLEKEISANGNIVYVYVFMAIELLILIVASANFMSLFTTQALKRIKEVGMRKVMGARPSQLSVQFFTEVTLLISVAAVLGVVFYQSALPLYNSLTGKSLGPFDIFQLQNIGMVGGILLIVLLLSGLYPALFIARFRPYTFFREGRLPKSIPNLIRSGMLTFQFAVAMSLIAATIIAGQQMNLLKNKDLGFDKEQVVVVGLRGDLRDMAIRDPDAFKNEFLKHPDILSVGRVDRMIGERLSVESVVPQDKPGETFPPMRLLRVDEGYLDAMKIHVIKGRNFTTSMEDASAFIINESAARALELSDPVGQTLVNQSNTRTGQVVGVVRDYHFATLHAEIEPLIIELRPDWTDELLFRLRAGKSTEALENIRATTHRLSPDGLFTYAFLDERIDALYKTEDTMGKVFQFFSALAIVIACMGLFGLMSYSLESRTKEIGIRKVLGATIGSVVSVVSSPVLKLIALAIGLAVPLTWYGMQQWLNNFAYRVQIQWWIFVLTGIGIVLIAAMAVAAQTIRAVSQNPVDALRNE